MQISRKKIENYSLCIIISIIKQKRQVILLGDTNARTSNLDDFLAGDVLHNDVLKDLCELIYYQTDEPLPRRNNPDPIVNDLGVKLLSLCKANGLRIFNGRHKSGRDNDFTIAGSKG